MHLWHIACVVIAIHFCIISLSSGGLKNSKIDKVNGSEMRDAFNKRSFERQGSAGPNDGTTDQSFGRFGDQATKRLGN